MPSAVRQKLANSSSKTAEIIETFTKESRENSNYLGNEKDYNYIYLEHIFKLRGVLAKSNLYGTR